MAIRPRLPEFPDLPGLAAGLAKAVYESQVEQPLRDMYWSLTNPIDRLAQRGRAANPQMAFPLGGRYTPRTPGLRAETLQRGDEFIGFDASPSVHNPPRRSFNEAAYNLRDESGKIVASATRERKQDGSRGVHVPEMWVDPAFRKSTAMFDLYNLLSRGGKERISATFANPDLEYVFLRRAKSQGQDIGEYQEKRLAQLTERRNTLKKRSNFKKKAEAERAAFDESDQLALEKEAERRMENMQARRRRDVPAYQPMATRPINVGAPAMPPAHARQLALALEMERRGEIAARRLPLDPRVESFQPIAASGRRARPGPTKFNPRRRSGV